MAFTASDVVSGGVDTNGESDVYIRDVLGGTAQLASRRFGPASVTPGGDSLNTIAQSADGHYVTFVNPATNLVQGQIDTEGAAGLDVFLRDRVLGTTILVSHVAG